MIIGRMEAKRVARILVIFSKENFSKVIGLKSTNESNLAFLGMKDRKKTLEVFRSV